MAIANRALSAPLNIHGDQSDSMAERDSGWIHIYVENAQEAYDSIIQAFKIAEDVGRVFADYCWIRRVYG